MIGIPTLAAVDPELGAAPGIGFAIPSDTAVDVASQIIEHGRVVNTRRAALGVRVGTAVDPLATRSASSSARSPPAGAPTSRASARVT